MIGGILEEIYNESNGLSAKLIGRLVFKLSCTSI